jgi:hypothetical protein
MVLQYMMNYSYFFLKVFSLLHMLCGYRKIGMDSQRLLTQLYIHLPTMV